MWAKGDKGESLNFLRQFASSLFQDIQVASAQISAEAEASEERLTELSKLLARCYRKIGDWQIQLGEDWGDVSGFWILLFASILLSRQRNSKDILQSYHLATHSDPTWSKAWHAWALANFDVVGYIENQNKDHASDGPQSGLVIHVVQAVEGTFPNKLEDKPCLTFFQIRFLPCHFPPRQRSIARHSSPADSLVQIRLKCSS